MAPNNATSNTTLFMYDVINNMLSFPVVFKRKLLEKTKIIHFYKTELGDNIKK